MPGPHWKISIGPGEHDLWPDSKSDGARILTPIAGDFEFEVRLSADFSSTQQVGILVWINASNYIRWQRGYNPNAYPDSGHVIALEVNRNGIYEVVHVNPCEEHSITLNIVRQRDIFIASYRTAEAQTRITYEVEIPESSITVQVGPFVVNANTPCEAEVLVTRLVRTEEDAQLS